MVLCRDVASLTVNRLDRCNLLWRRSVCYGTGKASYWPVLRMFCLSTFCPVQFSFAIAEQPEEGWAMSQMNLHFAVRFLIIGIALIYVVGPMFWHWREA